MARKIAVTLALLIAHAASAEGLGVTRAEVREKVDTYLQTAVTPSVKLEYEAGTLFSGEPRLMGTSDDPFIMLELIGDPADLESATVMFVPSGNDLSKNLVSLVVVVAIMQVTLPEWADSLTWFNNALESGAQKTEATRNGKAISLRNDTAIIGTVTLTVKKP